MKYRPKKGLCPPEKGLANTMASCFVFFQKLAVNVTAAFILWTFAAFDFISSGFHKSACRRLKNHDYILTKSFGSLFY